MIQVKARLALLWLTLRLTTLAVAVLAFLYEQGTTSLQPLKLLLAPWYNYDAVHYVRIVQYGYNVGEITSGFHPLYPWTARVLFLLFREPLVSLLIVTSIAGLLLTFVFFRLVRLDHDQSTSWTATALLLCWPASLAIFAPYTEALFLLLSVSCLLMARQRHFWIAGFLGGLAALTRQHGIFLTLPLAWEIWEASGKSFRTLFARWNALPSVLLVPAGYAVWIGYRAFVISDVQPDFSSVQRFIYSVMVSPTAYSIYQEQQFTWPWTAITKAAAILWNGGSHLSVLGDLTLAAAFIAMFIFGWRQLRTSYRIYSLVVILVALSYHTGSLNPYISLPRHMLPAFPVFIGFAASYRFKRLPFVLCVLGATQALFLCCYVWETWVL